MGQASTVTCQQRWRNRGRTRRGGLRAIYAIVSWLIDYPDEELLSRLPAIREHLDAPNLPRNIREDLLSTTELLGESDVYRLRSDYVETFDTRRRGFLFLTYFTNGDTRRRGRALVEIKDIYRQAGLEMDDSQLPDHLTCVLEFAAGHDLRSGVRILLANRAGVELLRLHLIEIDSPWAGALRALCATLPPLDGDDIHAVQRLAADGPEEETVGLDGLGGYGDAPPTAAPPTMSGSGCGAGAAGPAAAGGRAELRQAGSHLPCRRGPRSFHSPNRQEHDHEHAIRSRHVSVGDHPVPRAGGVRARTHLAFPPGSLRLDHTVESRCMSRSC